MLSYTELAVTVAEADAFAAARGWSDWTGTDADKGAALRRGQDYIASLYNARWLDEWEMADAPDLVKHAIIIAARYELVTPGTLSPVVAAGPEKILTGVGQIRWEVVNDGSNRRVPLIPALEGLLDGIATPSRGSTYTASFLRA